MPINDYYDETKHLYNSETGEVFSSMIVGSFLAILEGADRDQWRQITEKEYNYLLIHVSGLSFDFSV